MEHRQVVGASDKSSRVMQEQLLTQYKVIAKELAINLWLSHHSQQRVSVLISIMVIFATRAKHIKLDIGCVQAPHFWPPQRSYGILICMSKHTCNLHVY